MSDDAIPPGRQPAYRSKRVEERAHDPYQAGAKLPTPTLCPDCGAVYARGRWQWLPRPQTENVTRCPACRRVRDALPAGYVTLGGPFFAIHRAYVMDLVQDFEATEKAEHPLKRVMAISEQKDGVLVTTTDVHLASGIGEVVHRAYKGKLESHYSPEEMLVRVRWTR